MLSKNKRLASLHVVYIHIPRKQFKQHRHMFLAN